MIDFDSVKAVVGAAGGLIAVSGGAIAVHRWARKVPESRLQRRCEESARHKSVDRLGSPPRGSRHPVLRKGCCRAIGAPRDRRDSRRQVRDDGRCDAAVGTARDSGARPTARRGFLLLTRRVVDAKLIVGVQHLVPRPLMLLAQLQKGVLVGEGVPA